MTNEIAIKLRRTLRELKRQNALSGHTKVAYAADKTLNRLNDELEEYDYHERRIISEHSETDENGRPLVQNGEERYAIEENDDYQGTALFKPGTEKQVSEADLNGQMKRCFADREASNNEIEKLQEEEINPDLHQIDEGLFFKHADVQNHSRVDLEALDPWLKSAD